jgi:hypothetical protein
MLTADQVAEVLEAQRERRELSDKGLARRFGVDPKVIRAVIRRATVQAYPHPGAQPSRVKVGDRVAIVRGNWQGERGRVEEVFPWCVAVRTNRIGARRLRVRLSDLGSAA